MTDPIDVATIVVDIAVPSGTPAQPLVINIHPDMGPIPDAQASIGTFTFDDLAGLDSTPSTRTASSGDGSGATSLSSGVNYWVVFTTNVRLRLKWRP